MVTAESARTPVSSGVVASSRMSGGPNEALVENRTETATTAAVAIYNTPIAQALPER